MPPDIDARTIELIAEQVAEMLEARLEAIAARLIDGSGPRDLTVDQVAQRFGVARSTVYAHWRDWGGYKLGNGQRAPIRFDEAALRVKPDPGPREPEPKRVEKRRRRRDLLIDNPKGVQALDFAP